jgi:hypothetical protein
MFVNHTLHAFRQLNPPIVRRQLSSFHATPNPTNHVKVSLVFDRAKLALLRVFGRKQLATKLARSHNYIFDHLYRPP